ncbi:MAG: GIY-YIG nuclease family protein [Parvularculaceae bacterium]|nr:GIY-YIG nuclease family protein [Parvularculaceae bacterium]
MRPAVYIMTNKRCGTLYIGVTSDLPGRVWQHREGVSEGFTKKYGLKALVWHEAHPTMESAISREKQLKDWRRDWKIDLVNAFNPHWDDLWALLTVN